MDRFRRLIGNKQVMRDSDDEREEEEIENSWVELDSGNASDSSSESGGSLQSSSLSSPLLSSSSSNAAASPMMISHNNNNNNHNNNQAEMMNNNIASSPLIGSLNISGSSNQPASSSAATSSYSTFFSNMLEAATFSLGNIGTPKLDFLSKRRRKKKKMQGKANADSSDSECSTPASGFSPFSSPLLSSRFSFIPSHNNINNNNNNVDPGLTSFSLFSDLPIELKVSPLRYMTIPELHKASLVCKDWACMVERSQELWKGRVHKIQTFNTPPVRVCHGALTHKDCLYIYGGHVPSEQGDFITSVRSDLWEYNISTHEWKKVCNFEPLTETCPILYNDKMYIFGGFINSWRTSTIIEYDFATKKYIKMSTEDTQNVAGAPPKGRSAYSAVCYKNCMYIYGGWDGHESMNDIHCFNLDTKQWVPLEQATGSESVAPCVRSHCAWVWNDAMYVWGGFGQHGHPVDLFRYNFLEEDVSKRWTKVEVKGTPPCGRSRMKSFVHENRVLILGGWDRKKLLGDLWEFNMETLTWKELKHTGLPKGISQYSANLHKNLMLVFGGCSDGESSNNLYGFKMFSKQS